MHITQLREAINDLRGHMSLSDYTWQYSATTNDYISANPILEMRTALDQALGAPSPAYAVGLAQGQPIKAVHIQELRDRVLAAWSTGTALEINWLVADQLGTPRMIFDQTGSLANTKRHDYLPFGEELTTQGGRNTALGYAGDSIRQKFTSYERDIETNLDFAQARYYSSIHGRFTSVDPENAGATLHKPQTWNGYSYVQNNPLNSIDPTGLQEKSGEGNPDPCKVHKCQKDNDGNSYYLDANGDDVYVINAEQVVPSGDQRGFLTVDEALQQQKERRETFYRAQYFSIIGYGLGQIFSGVASIFRSGSSTTTVAVPSSAAKPLEWGSWGSYPKVIVGGNEYAEIGGRLYTYHVVERMMPRGLTTLGRSVSPTFVEEVIRTGTQSQRVVDGVLRTAHTSGSVSVITEDGGRIVVTVLTR